MIIIFRSNLSLVLYIELYIKKSIFYEGYPKGLNITAKFYSKFYDIPTKCDNKISQVFFILTTMELLLNRKDLWAPTLAGPLRLYQLLDLHT